jgi:hypothetical protein
MRKQNVQNLIDFIPLESGKIVLEDREDINYFDISYFSSNGRKTRVGTLRDGDQWWERKSVVNLILGELEKYGIE